jgi:hypothetical protein
VTAGKEITITPVLPDKPAESVTLYVIMSVAQQTKLEDYLTGFKSRPDSQVYANNLDREIAGLQDKVSGLGEPASVIIPTGGTTRGMDYATRFSEHDIYVRTITITVARKAR